MSFKISDEALLDGLKYVRWPGRFEVLRNDPDLVVDCAHNGASSRALAQVLKEEYPNRRIILVLGISRDKDPEAISHHLGEIAEHVILTKANHPRSYIFKEDEAKKYFGKTVLEFKDTLAKAIDKALEIAQVSDVIVVTGSIFLVAEAREWINFDKDKGERIKVN